SSPRMGDEERGKERSDDLQPAVFHELHLRWDPTHGEPADFRHRSAEIGHRVSSSCEMLRGGEIVKGMASSSGKSLPHPSASRRIVVVTVPPIDELDLVGPLEVFKSVNRLAGRTIYTIEVVTSADRRSVEGEGGVLTFVARHHFKKVEGVCDSVLLVCG